MYYVALALYVVVCLGLMLVILLQQGKGGDISSAFGGGGSGSQTAFGARSGATVLSRATTILAILFMVGALALGIMRQGNDGSVVGGRAPQAAPATAPAAPAATPADPAPAPEQ
jgi:preprotein translocase subunit SecG